MGCASSKKATTAPPLLAPFVNSATKAANPIKKCVLIYNPAGGRKKAQAVADTIVLPMLQEAGIAVEMKPTSHAGHGRELGRTLSVADVDAILVMGGDGTLAEVLDGFLQREDQAAATIPLGFIPAGTGNTYMREVLGIKTAGGAAPAVRAAVAAITGGYTRRVDCQRLDMHDSAGAPMVLHSINTVMAGFGPDANAVAEGRRWLGPMRYDISIKTEILKLGWRKPLASTLTIDGSKSELNDLFLFTCFVNKHTGTHHRLAPHAQLDDGKLDLCYTNQPVRSIPLAAKIDELIKTGGRHVGHPVVSMAQAQKVTLETATPARLMVDGDIQGNTPLTISVLPQAFTLFTPPEPAPS